METRDEDNQGRMAEQITPDDLDKNEKPEQVKSENKKAGSDWQASLQESAKGLFQSLMLSLNNLLDLKGIHEKLPQSWQQRIPENPRLLTLPIFIFLAGMVIIFLLGLLAPSASKKDAQIIKPIVRVVRAEKENVSIPVFSQGIVLPKTEIQIVSLVNGPVQEVSPNLVDGGKVEEGELLVLVSDRSYLQDLARAEANLARAKSAQIAKQSELRVQGTLRTTSGKAQLREVNAAVSAAEADVTRVNDLIENTKIIAPFSGIIRKAGLQKGQIISAGTPIALLFSVEGSVINIPLSDRQLALIDLSRLEGEESSPPDVKVMAEYGSQVFNWNGKLVRLAGGRNEINRLQYATVEVEGPYEKDAGQPGRPDLTPGFFVEVEVAGKQFGDIIRLPRKSLKTNQRVWGVSEENKLVTYNADIAHRDKDYIYIKSGIEDRALIVVSELEVFAQGMDVSPVFLDEAQQKAYEQELEAKNPKAETFFGKLREKAQALVDSVMSRFTNKDDKGGAAK